MADLGTDTIDQHAALQALAFELQNPLINIARRSEVADESTLKDIQQIAERALTLIDSCLLHARSEYGQQTLNLEPLIVGSVLYDTSQQLRSYAVDYNVSFVVEDRTDGPVMAHRAALVAILSAFGNALIVGRDRSIHREIVLRGYRTRGNSLGIGMFSREKLTVEDLQRAFTLQNKAYMPLSRISQGGNASLMIAEGLCRAVGGAMKVKRMGGLSGLATELPRSEQLTFV